MAAIPPCYAGGTADYQYSVTSSSSYTSGTADVIFNARVSYTASYNAPIDNTPDEADAEEVGPRELPDAVFLLPRDPVGVWLPAIPHGRPARCRDPPAG